MATESVRHAHRDAAARERVETCQHRLARIRSRICSAAGRHKATSAGSAMVAKPWPLSLLVLLLLASPVFVHVVSVRGEPLVGWSAVVIDDAAAQMHAAEGAVRAPELTFGLEGGADIPLGGTNEPTVAVNPLDPSNIVAASAFSLRVSTNNGGIFSGPFPAVVPPTHTLSGDSSLAFDSQGRLFWTYLGCLLASVCSGASGANPRFDIFIAGVNPVTGAILAGYPVNVTAAAGFPATTVGNVNDKEWLAADRFPGSPFQDRLYVVWTRFAATGTIVHTTFSMNQGLNWSAALSVSAAAEGFVWPSHNAVAPNGDVYVAYHSQPTSPGGASGQVFVLRSTNGGVSYPQKTVAYTGGNADITFNNQTAARRLNRSVSWTQGSAQPWVLPDPLNPRNVYVVAADDPTNGSQGAGFDDASVFIVRSTDQGLKWSAPAQIDPGPAGTTQFFPTAAIDDQSGCLTVTWYDTRRGITNAAGNFLLDVFFRASANGGLTFGPAVQLNDAPFNPDLGAPVRFPGPPPTLRIGEYNGVAILDRVAHAVWTGNTASGQQAMFDSAVVCTVTGVVDGFSGKAQGVGRARTGIAIIGTFLLNEQIDLGASPATLTILSLLNDGTRDVVGLPLTLLGDPRNNAKTAYFNTAVGVVPIATVAIGAQGNGKFTFHIKVSQATSVPSDQCPNTTLTTAFEIQGGGNPLVAVSTQQPWLCFGTGNQYLKSPP